MAQARESGLGAARTDEPAPLRVLSAQLDCLDKTVDALRAAEAGAVRPRATAGGRASSSASASAHAPSSPLLLHTPGTAPARRRAASDEHWELAILSRVRTRLQERKRSSPHGDEDAALQKIERYMARTSSVARGSPAFAATPADDERIRASLLGSAAGVRAPRAAGAGTRPIASRPHDAALTAAAAAAVASSAERSCASSAVRARSPLALLGGLDLVARFAAVANVQQQQPPLSPIAAATATATATVRARAAAESHAPGTSPFAHRRCAPASPAEAPCARSPPSHSTPQADIAGARCGRTTHGADGPRSPALSCATPGAGVGKGDSRALEYGLSSDFGLSGIDRLVQRIVMGPVAMSAAPDARPGLTQVHDARIDATVAGAAAPAVTRSLIYDHTALPRPPSHATAEHARDARSSVAAAEAAAAAVHAADGGRADAALSAAALPPSAQPEPLAERAATAGRLSPPLALHAIGSVIRAAAPLLAEAAVTPSVTDAPAVLVSPLVLGGLAAALELARGTGARAAAPLGNDPLGNHVPTDACTDDSARKAAASAAAFGTACTKPSGGDPACEGARAARPLLALLARALPAQACGARTYAEADAADGEGGDQVCAGATMAAGADAAVELLQRLRLSQDLGLCARTAMPRHAAPPLAPRPSFPTQPACLPACLGTGSALRAQLRPPARPPPDQHCPTPVTSTPARDRDCTRRSPIRPDASAGTPDNKARAALDWGSAPPSAGAHARAGGTEERASPACGVLAPLAGEQAATLFPPSPDSSDTPKRASDPMSDRTAHSVSPVEPFPPAARPATSSAQLPRGTASPRALTPRLAQPASLVGSVRSSPSPTGARTRGGAALEQHGAEPRARTRARSRGSPLSTGRAPATAASPACTRAAPIELASSRTPPPAARAAGGAASGERAPAPANGAAPARSAARETRLTAAHGSPVHARLPDDAERDTMAAVRSVPEGAVAVASAPGMEAPLARIGCRLLEPTASSASRALAQSQLPPHATKMPSPRPPRPPSAGHAGSGQLSSSHARAAGTSGTRAPPSLASPAARSSAPSSAKSAARPSPPSAASDLASLPARRSMAPLAPAALEASPAGRGAPWTDGPVDAAARALLELSLIHI